MTASALHKSIIVWEAVSLRFGKLRDHWLDLREHWNHRRFRKSNDPRVCDFIFRLWAPRHIPVQHHCLGLQAMGCGAVVVNTYWAMDFSVRRCVNHWYPYFLSHLLSRFARRYRQMESFNRCVCAHRFPGERNDLRGSILHL